MQIQINTDHNIRGHAALIATVTDVVENALSRFSEHITHVEVHLSDENSDKKGGRDDMRCMLEARLEGRPAIAVTHQATTLDEAVEGAVDKLANLIENTLERQHDQELRRTDPPVPEPKFKEPS
jgi:ribosome-associated translation inhibitor RaiA